MTQDHRHLNPWPQQIITKEKINDHLGQDRFRDISWRLLLSIYSLKPKMIMMMMTDMFHLLIGLSSLCAVVLMTTQTGLALHFPERRKLLLSQGRVVLWTWSGVVVLGWEGENLIHRIFLARLVCFFVFGRQFSKSFHVESNHYTLNCWACVELVSCCVWNYLNQHGVDVFET